MFELDTILEIILEKYKSLEHPDFSFVNTEINKVKYAKIISEIATSFEVVENTDLNDDVSFCYVLTKDSKEWYLQISTLGPYVVLFRLDDLGKVKDILTEDCPFLIHVEKELVSILSNNKLYMLDLHILQHPVPLRLCNTDFENVTIYQALFSDVDIPPWQKTCVE